MSIWGYIVLFYILVGSLMVFRYKLYEAIMKVTGLLILCVQAIFIFNDGFSLFPFSLVNLVLGLIVITFLITLIRKTTGNMLTRKSMTVLLAVIIASVFYTEIFNGVYSFENQAKYLDLNMKLKKYHRVFPFKLVSSEVAKGDVNRQATGYLFSGFVFYARPVSFGRNGDIYYYKPRGFGEPGNWFKYGIPEGQQIASR